MSYAERLCKIADQSEQMEIDLYETAAQIRQVAKDLDWANVRIKNFFTAEELEGMSVRQLRAKMLELQDAARAMAIAVDAYVEIREEAKIGKNDMVQEFEQSGRHRLVNKATGKSTDWATYSQYTYLDGHVGFTAYFSTKEGICTPTEFIKMTAMTESENG